MTRPIPLFVVVVLAVAAAAAPAALAEDVVAPAARGEAGAPAKPAPAPSEAGNPAKLTAPAHGEAGTPAKLTAAAHSEAGTPSKPTTLAAAVPGDSDAANDGDADDAAKNVDDAAAGDVAALPEPTRPPPMELDDEQMRTLPPPSIGAGELLGPLAKTMVMLLVVLGIVYLTLHKGLGKLMERQNMGKRMKVVERVSLDTKRTLFLVDVDGKQMVLAAGEGGIVVIKDMSPPEPKRDFAEVLATKPSNQTPISADASATRATGA